MGLTILNSVEAAQAFSASWAADLVGGEIFAFHGVLGAGKTQLAKGLARGLGYRGDVTSPTFTIVHEYRGGRLPLYHIDLYRIQSEKDALDIGIEEYLPSNGVTIIEWPDRIPSLLPPETRHWELEVVSLTERVIRQLAETPTTKSMLDLAFDTSSSIGSIALGNNKVVVQSIEFKGPQRHSASLFPALVRLGIPRLKLRRIIVGIGPGSFSGIRVSLAAAQGIALVQKVPVIGICSAYSVALQNKEVTRLGVFADAKRREAFCTVFQNGELEKETYLIPMAEIEEHASKFTLAVSAEPLAGIPTRVYPRARDLLALPETLPGWVTQQPLEPIYLREPVAAK